MKTTEIILHLTEKNISELGYELIDVQFQKEQNGWVLTLYIDNESGITVEDCEKVSRAVEPLIDEADPIAQTYFLSVSSPGLDRPLKTERDYKKNIGKDVVIKLYAKQDGKKEFIGKLLAYEDEKILLSSRDGKEHAFHLKDVALVKPHIVF